VQGKEVLPTCRNSKTLSERHVMTKEELEKKYREKIANTIQRRGGGGNRRRKKEKSSKIGKKKKMRPKGCKTVGRGVASRREEGGSLLKKQMG